MSAEQTVDASDPRSFATAVCQRAAAAGDCQDRVKWCFIAGLGRFSGGVAPGIIDDGATASKAGSRYKSGRISEFLILHYGYSKQRGLWRNDVTLLVGGNSKEGQVSMFVTVAICTRNRAESLRRTLDSLAALRIPNGLTWEIVIVHNSTDHTDEVIGEYLDRLPMRKELETQSGLSNARNQAIDTAKGEYIVWTDDDVIVDPRWLSAYVEAFRRWPEAAVFGGRIKPRYEPPVPRWLTEGETLLEGPFAIRDFGDRVQRLSTAGYRIPFGANFAIRAKEQRAFRYDPNLGAGPTRPRSDEEVDVIAKLLDSGALGYWIPDAMVEHCIGRDRQTVHYIALFYQIWGETWAFRNEAAIAKAPFWFGIPRRIWPRLFGGWVLYHSCRWVLPVTVWVKYLKIYSWNKGMFAYWAQKRTNTLQTANAEG